MLEFTTGLSLGFSLIIAIGAQNAFVLRQGLQRQFVFSICLLCAGSDAILISLGVWGFSAISAFSPWIEPAARYGGAVFLFYYGGLNMWLALRNSAALKPATGTSKSWWLTAATCLALTWLNPHVYLDTLVLLGAISTQFPDAKLQFALGAILASFSFFYALGYGARILTPIFTKPKAWRIFYFAVALLMWAIALGLLYPVLR